MEIVEVFKVFLLEVILKNGKIFKLNELLLQDNKREIVMKQ